MKYLFSLFIFVFPSFLFAALPSPYLANTTPSTVTYTVPQGTTYSRLIEPMPPGGSVTNSGNNFRLPNYTSTPLPNGTTINATLVREVAKSAFIDRLANAIRKNVNPYAIPLTIATAYIIDELIKQGIEWQKETQEWLKKPLDNGLWTYSNGFSPASSGQNGATSAEWVAFQTQRCNESTGGSCPNTYSVVDYGNNTGCLFFRGPYGSGCVDNLYKTGTINSYQKPTESDIQSASTGVVNSAQPDNVIRGLDDLAPTPASLTDPVTVTPSSTKIEGKPTTSTSQGTKADGTTTTTTITNTPVTNITNSSTNNTTNNSNITYNTTNVTNTKTTTTAADGSTKTDTETKTEEDKESPPDVPPLPPMNFELPPIAGIDPPAEVGFIKGLFGFDELASATCSNPIIEIMGKSIELKICPWLEKFRPVFEWFWNCATAFALIMMMRRVNLKTGQMDA